VEGGVHRAATMVAGGGARSSGSGSGAKEEGRCHL
jgi:hypothetical protein